MNIKYTYDHIINMLNNAGYKVLTAKNEYSYKGKIAYEDSFGYKYIKNINNIIRNLNENKLVGKHNIYSLYNINHYLKLNNIPFVCVSDKYIDAETKLEFECLSCKTHVFTSWHNINKNDNPSRNYIICTNCGGKTESLHALILKQVFKHEHPDTVEEDKSCRSTITGKIMPTDIVNHRLKIAVEVQSQWHDFADKAEKDAIKKQFWIDKGYKFYALDIRDYSILEMCQVFFNIDKLPDYIDYNYSNKINVKEIQDLINKGRSIPEIEQITGVARHRIYDAKHSGKINYAEQYNNPLYCPIVQLDKNGKYIREFSSINEANNFYGFKRGTISSALNKGRHYSCGYYWYKKEEYDNCKSIDINSRFSKFYIPTDKFDKNDNYICSYDTIIDAAKDCGVSNTQIYNVVIGKNKSTGGFKFKSKNIIL